MISKNKIKFIKSLDSKKERQLHKCFIAEGEKIVEEIISSNIKIDQIYALESWVLTNKLILDQKHQEVELVTQDELSKISFLKTPQPVFCVANLPENKLSLNLLSNKLTLMLDRVQDPGNLGTIIRIADWFGIENIICSIDSADAFNPKVVQATMGAICRVHIYYQEFAQLLPEIKQSGLPIYGTTLEGENIFNTPLQANGFIMMGNESIGISPEWRPFLTKELFLPNYPEGMKRSESLNVAIAASLVCSEFRRQLSFPI